MPRSSSSFPRKMSKQGQLGRARSQTALIAIDAVATEPWLKAFRWRIPHLPRGDSVDFTFQALTPSSDQYVAALYNAERVVINKVSGEPSSRSGSFFPLSPVRFTALSLSWLLFMVLTLPFGSSEVPPDARKPDLDTTLSGAGCRFNVSIIPERQFVRGMFCFNDRVEWFVTYRIFKSRQ